MSYKSQKQFGDRIAKASRILIRLEKVYAYLQSNPPEHMTKAWKQQIEFIEELLNL